jgi:hypothetical protein
MAKSVKGKFKARCKRRVVAVLAALTVFFGVLYLPDEVTRVFGQRFEMAGAVLAKLGVMMLPFALVASWFLFGQDHLATGRGKASQFFRHYYPSTFAVMHCKKSKAEADNLWFTYFNRLENPNHPLHTYYETSFDRTYTCRLFYYLVRILTWYLAAAAVSVILVTWVFPTQDADKMLAPRIIAWVVFALLTVSIALSNRIKKVPGTSYYDAYDPTGSYYRYKEIQGILQQHFWREVLGPGGCPPPS